ncbi:hypothetical protein [Gymnodinialimonas hymeniacidonis]|uniref:hypothetical protein n=1 Tax=Gymnodinialimonas hymeniacidonis TaxID=3126508 RepID=UPI0034C63C47
MIHFVLAFMLPTTSAIANPTWDSFPDRMVCQSQTPCNLQAICDAGTPAHLILTRDGSEWFWTVTPEHPSRGLPATIASTVAEAQDMARSHRLSDPPIYRFLFVAVSGNATGSILIHAHEFNPVSRALIPGPLEYVCHPSEVTS